MDELTKKSLLEERGKKGGYTSNRIRESGIVHNYFANPGRMNIIPDAKDNRSMDVNFNNKAPIISSIGKYKLSGNKLVASGTSGPGTLVSSNVQVVHPHISSAIHQGYVHLNEKRTSFVDYRSTAPWLVENLRKNPLSIYAVDEAKNKDIPAFFTYVRPNTYESYQSLPNKVEIDSYTINQAIDGNPQTNILGLARQNPFMGLTVKVQDKPEFLGKTYGGNNRGLAKPIAEKLYNQNWTTNFQKPVLYDSRKNQENSLVCKNKALVPFAQGYNISGQVNDGKAIEWIGSGETENENLPWSLIWTNGNNPNPL